MRRKRVTKPGRQRPPGDPRSESARAPNKHGRSAEHDTTHAPHHGPWARRLECPGTPGAKPKRRALGSCSRHRPRTPETAAGPAASKGGQGPGAAPVRRLSGVCWPPDWVTERGCSGSTGGKALGGGTALSLRHTWHASPVPPAHPRGGRWGGQRPPRPAPALTRPNASTLTRCCLPTGDVQLLAVVFERNAILRWGKRELLVRALLPTDTEAFLTSLPPRPPLAVPPHGDARDLVSGPQTRAAAIAPLGQRADEADSGPGRPLLTPQAVRGPTSRRRLYRGPSRGSACCSARSAGAWGGQARRRPRGCRPCFGSMNADQPTKRTDWLRDWVPFY